MKLVTVKTVLFQVQKCLNTKMELALFNLFFYFMCVHACKFLNVFQYVCGGQRTTLVESVLSFYQYTPEIKFRSSALATGTFTHSAFLLVCCCCSFVSFLKKKNRLLLNDILSLHYQYNFILNVVSFIYTWLIVDKLLYWVFFNYKLSSYLCSHAVILSCLIPYINLKTIPLIKT